MAHRFRSAVISRAAHAGALARVFDATLPLLLAVTAARAQFAENFDTLTPPALPPSWTTANFGFAWTTTTNTPNSPPNCATATGLDRVSEAYLDSTLIDIGDTTHLVRFRHRFVLEAQTEQDPGNPLLGFDGGVLEIAIGDNDYEDILAAGGIPLAGNYTHPISSDNGSLIGGRQAWSGDSGGYIATSIRLPPSTINSTFRLRFRLSCDVSNGGGVWAIDSLDVVDECVSQDTEPPVLVCPEAMTRPIRILVCDNLRNKVGDFTTIPTVTDNCPNPLVLAQDPPAETVIGLGTTPITVTATDLAGNVGQCTTELTLVDPVAGQCGLCLCGGGFVDMFIVTFGSLAGRKLSRRRYRPVASGAPAGRSRFP
jgi:HYR domain-containing protein